MEHLDQWRKAGKIAAEALDYGKSLIKNGANIRDVCDKIDKKIIDLGAFPAWPSQVGFGGIAAHWTPDAKDELVFDNQVVCLDVGAHIDGFVGDNACTVDLSGKWRDLLKASEEALDAAIKTIQIGTPLGEIGKAIQEVIESHDFSPIKNLSGHGISRWVIHDKPSIPNFDTKDKRVLTDGQIIAIEPFATNGAGMIFESDKANIFSLEETKPMRSPYARDVLSFIYENYRVLPFADRWLVKQFGEGKTRLAVHELMRSGCLHAHPPLIEKNKGMVAVFENTIIVGEKPEVTTRI